MQGRPYSKREERAMVREGRLKELGYSSYDAYLKSPAWRDLKDRYRASDLPQICMCGDTKVQFHHTTYERVGCEQLEDLLPLCQACHAQAHVLEAAGVIELTLEGFYYDLRRAWINAAIERKRKALAAEDFAVALHKQHDVVSTKLREGAEHARQKKAQRGRYMRLRAEMRAARPDTPEVLAERRERLFAEAIQAAAIRRRARVVQRETPTQIVKRPTAAWR